MFCTLSNHFLIWDAAPLLRYKSKPNIKKGHISVVFLLDKWMKLKHNFIMAVLQETNTPKIQQSKTEEDT